MEDKNGNKKKTPAITLIGLCLVILSAVSSENGAAAIGIAIFVLAVFAIIGAVLKSAKKGTVHSHDRLNTKGVVVERHEGIDHYKIQLDGFLRAGIIDRKEYNVLLKKYTKELQKNK